MVTTTKSLLHISSIIWGSILCWHSDYVAVWIHCAIRIFPMPNGVKNRNLHERGLPYLIIIMPPPQNDFLTTISTAVYRKWYIQFCVENAKCVIFLAELFQKSVCESNNTFCRRCWPKEKLYLLFLRLRNVDLWKSSTRKNEITRVILSQMAR